MLREKYHFSVEEAKKIADFLTPMLELPPEARANAGGMSNSELMKGVKGMETCNVETVPLTKGEGIDGWAVEVKKR